MPDTVPPDKGDEVCGPGCTAIGGYNISVDTAAAPQYFETLHTYISKYALDQANVYMDKAHDRAERIDSKYTIHHTAGAQLQCSAAKGLQYGHAYAQLGQLAHAQPIQHNKTTHGRYVHSVLSTGLSGNGVNCYPTLEWWRGLSTCTCPLTPQDEHRAQSTCMDEVADETIEMTAAPTTADEDAKTKVGECLLGWGLLFGGANMERVSTCLCV